ncbi:FAD-dependent monooxygenase [Nocardia bovistercoris]|uniref:FAD-dependent oxidoreductase n=1 Tax=Nocardia bovistercoris TaxID=2785916 RepID=A0A931N1Q0_9NOCA|nr:FAD-dependent monooxygenase [Nocardia bovistercoris]MBH0775161.1 FAD-dependent oxidoreductase [Nocardia bovistercoris]
MAANILISGAGVAGATLAYWLARRGDVVTVVERASGQRSSGNPVDVKGFAIDVVRRMGILPRLREAATSVDRMTFVDARGEHIAALPLSAFGSGSEALELPRADLAGILTESAREIADFRWGQSIAAVAQDAHGVDVTFENAESGRFDLLIGADGLHSAVRRLAFGPETRFRTDQGMYVATLPVPTPFGSEREAIFHGMPGRAVGVHPAAGRAVAAFFFRRDPVPDLDHRDLATHKRLVIEAFRDARWRVPELLDQVRSADDLYFDSVSRIDLPRWSTGRVVLVGDAASCLSLLGDGSTLAIAGAYRLAESLTATVDHTAGFVRYESAHRRSVEPRQRGFRVGAALLVPESRAGLLARNTAVRVIGAAAGRRARCGTGA